MPAGQQIGEVGDLGNATGCHLHFEVHPRGGSIYQDDVDPSAWLKAHVGRDDGTVPVRSASWSGSSEAFTVATFNVLGNSHTGPGGKAAGMASGPARIRGAVRLLERYGVDVVGLQEFQRPQAGRVHPARRLDLRALVGPRGDRERDRLPPRPMVPRRRRNRRDPVLQRPHPSDARRATEDRATGAQVTFVNVHNPADTRRYRHQGSWRAKAVAREVALRPRAVARRHQ